MKQNYALSRLAAVVMAAAALVVLLGLQSGGSARADPGHDPGDPHGSATLIAAAAIQEAQAFSDPLRIELDPSRISFTRAKYLPLPPSGKVTVQLRATAVDAAVPGEFKFYLAADEASRLFTTISLEEGQPIPRGQELADGIAFVDPGVWYTLQVVYENPTDEPVAFYVSAPSVDPEAALPFARALCWCAAVPFKAPADGAFYRTIKVGVAKNTPAGARAIVDWPVVLINE